MEERAKGTSKKSGWRGEEAIIYEATSMYINETKSSGKTDTMSVLWFQVFHLIFISLVLSI